MTAKFWGTRAATAVLLRCRPFGRSQRAWHPQRRPRAAFATRMPCQSLRRCRPPAAALPCAQCPGLREAECCAKTCRCQSAERRLALRPFGGSVTALPSVRVARTRTFLRRCSGPSCCCPCGGLTRGIWPSHRRVRRASQSERTRGERVTFNAGKSLICWKAIPCAADAMPCRLRHRPARSLQGMASAARC